MYLSRQDINKYNSWIVFICYTALSCLILYALQHLVLKDEMYYASLGDRLTTDRIGQLLENRKKLEWLNYVFVPLKLLLKTGFTAVCIYMGCLLTDRTISFRNIFKVALLCELVFILAAFVSFLLLLLSIRPASLEDTARADVFSLHALVSFFKIEIPDYLIYPLQVVNMYEISYWLMLATGLKACSKKPFHQMLALVMSSYGIGLLSWVAFIEFLLISFS